jgi:hypothetical protein
VQITFKDDGTYYEQGSVTMHGTELQNQVGTEEQGNYSFSADGLILTNKMTREFDLATKSWEGWTVTKERQSTEKIRNVTPTTFQLYDDTEKAWFTFSKL